MYPNNFYIPNQTMRFMPNGLGINTAKSGGIFSSLKSINWGGLLNNANKTLNVVNHCKYDSAFTFIYSPREGTPAAKMPDAIDMKTKEERLYRLNEVINSYSNAANKAYLDKVVPVLIEGISEKDPNKVFGYTDTMKLVNVINAQDKIGQIIDVKITDAKSFSLDGEAI